MIRKSPYQWGEWPSNGCGVKKQTPSATRLFGGGKQKHETIAGDHTGESCRNHAMRGFYKVKVTDRHLP